MMTQKRPRPAVVGGATYQYPSCFGNVYVTINSIHGEEFEVFVSSSGKAGNCAGCLLEGISRLASLALRHSIAPEEIIDQLKGLTCPEARWDKGGRLIGSCADAVACALIDNSMEMEGSSG